MCPTKRSSTWGSYPMSKVCNKCGEEKRLSEYHKHKACKGGLNPRCKVCRSGEHREYLRKNPEVLTEEQRSQKNSYSKEWRKRNKGKVKEKNRQWYAANKGKRNLIQHYLQDKYGGTPCMDCDGVFDWCAMDFDHRPSEVKMYTIGSKSRCRNTPERILEIEKEIEKCDIVCSNCHRIRTFVTRKK